MLRSIGTAMAAALWLAASSNPVRVTASAPEDPARQAIAMGSGGPPAKPKGGCWGQDTIPAVIETVTDTVQDQPDLRDATGKITNPPVTKTPPASASCTTISPFIFAPPGMTS